MLDRVPHLFHNGVMPSRDQLLVDVVPNGPFVGNCIIAADTASRSAILIDPGDEEARLIRRLEELELNLIEIVATHGHIDHVGAVEALQRTMHVPFAMHPADLPLLDVLEERARHYGLPARKAPSVDRELSHDQVLQVGELRARIIHTPGHSPGGCCICFDAQRVVMVGDTLFAGSIGRTDLPGGSTRQLLTSIRERLLTLEDDFMVHCGHGPPTTIVAERRTNPFLTR